MGCPVETIGVLEGVAGLAHGLLGKAAGVEVGVERAEAIERLRPAQEEALRGMGIAPGCLVTCDQVYGARVRRVGLGDGGREMAACDALVTAEAGVALGILVADCCPVWVVDPVRRAVGLAHAGRRGVELGVVPATVAALHGLVGSEAEDLVVVLGPCIRPPHFEIDMPGLLVEQLLGCGVPGEQIHDHGACTYTEAEKYYSYRREEGRTGRMMGVLVLSP